MRSHLSVPAGKVRSSHESLFTRPRRSTVGQMILSQRRSCLTIGKIKEKKNILKSPSIRAVQEKNRYLAVRRQTQSLIQIAGKTF